MGIQSFETQLKTIGLAGEINNTSEFPFPPLPSRDKNSGSKNNSQAPTIALECGYFIVNNL